MWSDRAQPRSSQEAPMTDATNMVLVIGLGLCVPVLFGVTLWLAWPFLRRMTRDDPC